MGKKIMQILISVMLVFGLLMSRLFFLTSSVNLNTIALKQNTHEFIVGNNRANIYDRNYEKLTNMQIGYKALVPEDFTEIEKLKPYLLDEEKFIRDFNNKNYTLADVKHGGIPFDDIEVITYKQRYSENQLASHIIGYVDEETGDGISGIEKGYNAFLSEGIDKDSVTFTKTAKNELLKGSKKIENNETNQGVLTTLDIDLQKIIKDVGDKHIEKGSILVSDSKTNEILAMESFPSFDPRDVKSSLGDENSPFINRNLTTISVGSTFKLFIAGVALENGVDKNLAYDCTGEIDINGQIYQCHNKEGHGTQNLESAIMNSCNPYFVNLATKLSPESLNSNLKLLGFDKEIVLGDGVTAKSGTIPTIEELENIGEKSNFSFGQGKLLATPVHISNLLNMIINNGEYIEPTLIQGEVYSTVSEPLNTKQSTKIFSPETCEFLKGAMVKVIEQGTGKLAKPNEGVAGGKTATAQTGQFTENGEEKLTGWFSGFYPAEEPKYTIIVMLEHGGEGGVLATPVFKEIIDEINKLT